MWQNVINLDMGLFTLIRYAILVDMAMFCCRNIHVFDHGMLLQTL